MTGRLEVVIDGGTLEAEATGRGEPVVVIQTALTCDELRPLSRHLASGGTYRVLHYHRRGYAGSSQARSDASVAADGADAAAFIRSTNAAPAHVVGVSYSAAVALSLAGSSPDLVRTLTVVEPPPAGTPGAAGFRRAAQELREGYEARGARVALDEFMTMLVGVSWREQSERDLPGSVAAMERDASTFFERDVPALLAWDFGAKEASRIRCPVLSVGGGGSGPWFTEMRARLLSLLPDAEEATVEGAGHLVASTHAPQVARLALQHFRRTPTPGPGWSAGERERR